MTSGFLSHPVDVAAVPQHGADHRLVATAAERELIAEEFGLIAVDSLAADFQIAPALGGGFALTGRVTASVVHRCVVTLEPVRQELEEEVALDLVPEGLAAAVESGPILERDPPEILSGRMVDLGAIAREYFAVGLDPYPRAPGAELPAAVESDEATGPFAALAALSTSKTKTSGS